MKIILVNGLFVHDSGKTWFSTALTKYLISQGYRASIYKPVAGHSAWTQYTTVVRSKMLKLLVGSDVLTYLDLGIINREEIPITNPVDLLMSPVDVAKYLNNGAFGRYLIDAFDQFKQMVLARITSCEGSGVNHFIIKSNLNHVAKSLMNDLLELSNVVGAREIELDNLVKMLKQPWIDDNLNLCLKRRCEGKDVILVESFNDAFIPYISLLEHLNGVISIGHGYTILFDDLPRIRKLVKEVISDLGEEGLKSSNIVDKLNPSSIIEIPPRVSVSYMQGMDWKPIIRAIFN
ncbi:MAG: hypothetical protein RMH77_01975 [Sulfolobales archaeon]|nr:hypothetical protein [Sulfolobales archaeon]MCX8185899.1 hypothetical protein [Sulfolobales archaeon]MDW7969156.1 hypothetical protein [Sulfolobales archaeon]